MSQVYKSLQEEPVLRHDVRSLESTALKFTIRLVSSLGETIGYLDYCERCGSPHIEFISVIHRLKGHATRMLAALQARYPDREIEWGHMTPAGKALRSGLPTKQVPTPHAPAFARLARLNARILAMDVAIQESRDAGVVCAGEIRARECLARHADTLEGLLDRKRPHITVLDIAMTGPTSRPLANPYPSAAIPTLSPLVGRSNTMRRIFIGTIAPASMSSAT